MSNALRGSHRRCSVKGRRICLSLVLRKLLVLVIFTRNRLCWSIFLIAWPEGLQLYSKETATEALSCECSEIFENTYFANHIPKAASVLWSDFVY